MASYTTSEIRGGLKVLLDGDPYTVIENEFVSPSTKVVLFAEVIAGGWSTVNTNDWTASGLTPFEAVICRG